VAFGPHHGGKWAGPPGAHAWGACTRRRLSPGRRNGRCALPLHQDQRI